MATNAEVMMMAAKVKILLTAKGNDNKCKGKDNDGSTGDSGVADRQGDGHGISQRRQKSHKVNPVVQVCEILISFFALSEALYVTIRYNTSVRAEQCPQTYLFNIGFFSGHQQNQAMEPIPKDFHKEEGG